MSNGIVYTIPTKSEWGELSKSVTPRALDFYVSPILREVQESDFVIFEEKKYRVLKKTYVEDGDLYLTGRNYVQLLQAASVNHADRWVVPTDSNAYYFDIWECVPVELVEDLEVLCPNNPDNKSE